MMHDLLPHRVATPFLRMSDPIDTNRVLDAGRRALAAEADAVSALAGRLDASFVTACRICLACRGRVVVTGMGKSGHVGGKIAATLASTGTPAFFLHPAEASHGDFGMITRDDVVLALSNSGETAEVLIILPLIKRMGVPLIALTGRAGSTLAREADVHLDVSVPADFRRDGTAWCGLADRLHHLPVAFHRVHRRDG